MYTLNGKTMRFSLDKNGQVRSLFNKLTFHEYVHIPDNLWRIVYKEDERMELAIYSLGQRFEISSSDNEMILTYDGLQGEDRMLDILLKLRIVIKEDRLLIYTTLKSNDDAAEIMEIYISAASGVFSLSGNPKEDILTISKDLGKKHEAPATNYDRGILYRNRQQFHRDINMLYPGESSMQWFDLYNEKEGLYIGSHDPSLQITCMHVERDMKKSTLKLGVIRYPFLKKGETWESAPVVYAVHLGDWHQGAKIYRKWIEKSLWKAPDNPEWVKNFKGWLRIILKQQYGHINWKYSDLPELFDEVKAAGFDTMMLLGWERGGFGRMRPEYIPDPRMGGEEELKKAIKYIHSKGGHVIIYVSYFIISYESDFYKTGGGKDVLLKSQWGREIIFRETHTGEGTWRGMPGLYGGLDNGIQKPQCGTCQDTPLWQEILKEFADIAMGLGADGIMYDIGGFGPFFCYADSHPHKKPNLSVSSKADNFGKLKSHIREKNQEKAILMEHIVDVFSQHMNITQGMTTLISPEHFFELYRYTFPEIIETNRNCANDEDNYRANANKSFLYGLRFDMSVHRCNSSLSAIPDYTEYVKKLNGLLDQYSDYILKGKFIDNEGFILDNQDIIAKAYQAADGSVAVALWNPTDEIISFTLKPGMVCSEGESSSIGLDRESFKPKNKEIKAELKANSVGVYIL